MSASSKLQSACVKTRMCRFFTEGSCRLASTCPFAHGPEELKPPPDLQRTKVCPMLIRRGLCEDINCSYAHSKDQLRKVDLAREAERAYHPPGEHEIPIVLVPEPLKTAPPTVQHQQQPGRVIRAETMPEPRRKRVMRSKFHKTKMCEFFQKGKCLKRGACRFAHSEAELVGLTGLCPATDSALAQDLLAMRSVEHPQMPSLRGMSKSTPDRDHLPPALRIPTLFDRQFSAPEATIFDRQFSAPMAVFDFYDGGFIRMESEGGESAMAVKNTFVEVQDDIEAAPLRRIKSAIF